MLKQKPWSRTILILLVAVALLAVGGVVGYQLGLRASLDRVAGQFDPTGAFGQGQAGGVLPEGFQATAEAFRAEGGLPQDFQGQAQGLRQTGGLSGGLSAGSLLPWLIAGGLLVALLVVVLVLAFRMPADQAATAADAPESKS